MKRFLKQNWLYIILFCMIVALNVLMRMDGGEVAGEAPRAAVDETQSTGEAAAPKPESLFVDFEEAKERSARIEGTLKENAHLYLFYISINLLIIFVFLLGLMLDGYFIASKVKKRTVIQKSTAHVPPAWSVGDVAKIIILAFSFAYAFFIVLNFCLGVIETVAGTKFMLVRNENFRMIFDTIILDGIVLIIVLRFLRVVHRSNVARLGFSKEHAGRNIFYGVCGYIGVIPILTTIGIIVYIIINILKLKPPPQPIVQLFLVEQNVALIFISSIIASVFGPVIEEIFFRGIMYNALKRKLGIPWSILVTSVLFSFLHTHAMTYFLVGFVPIMILGIVLAYLYEKTGSLIPSVTLHVLNNMGSVFMVFLFKYFNHAT
jgi:membrane protease YdiL (CAAX protease family)